MSQVKIHSSKVENTSTPMRIRAKEANNRDIAFSYTAILFCVALAVQVGLQPLLTKSFSNDPRILKSSLVLVTEAIKIMISVVLIACEDSSTRRFIYNNFHVSDSLKHAAFPAVLYAIQNLLTQFGYDKIDGITFNVLNQTKTISAAVCLYFLLGKVQSTVQMLALFLIMIAACILNMGASQNISDKDYSNFQVGVIMVLAASAISGLSGALSQKALSGIEQPRHSILLSSEMAVYGIIFIVGRILLTSSEIESIQTNGFWNGWTWYTFIPVTANAAGGLIVGLVTKYSGTISKGFSLISGLVLTGFVEWCLGFKKISWTDILSAFLVCISIYLHSSSPPQYPGPKTPEVKSNWSSKKKRL